MVTHYLTLNYNKISTIVLYASISVKQTGEPNTSLRSFSDILQFMVLSAFLQQLSSNQIIMNFSLSDSIRMHHILF